MTDEQIEILSPIFSELVIWKKEKLKKHTELNNFLISNFERLNFINTNTKLTHVDNILIEFKIEKEKIKEKNKTQSVLFNPLSFFPIGETMHSFLIANLINPNSEHGQGDLFLKLFLKILNIDDYKETDNWIVTAETGRIDILIKRQNPHTVIVIENKSNFAIDQENQLYRYWHQEIYLPNLKQFGSKTVEKITNNKNYRVIYLTPADWKIPSNHTQLKPIGYNKDLPSTMPIVPEIWVFNNQIVEWLSHSLNQLNKENHRLREYIKQYIELWN
jgi:hypothetical protein